LVRKDDFPDGWSGRSEQEMRLHGRALAGHCALTLAVAACSQPVSDRSIPPYFGSGDAKCPSSKLQLQGFTGHLDKGATIKSIGAIDNGRIKVGVYFYDFVNPESNHGNHRILILDQRCNYMGSYAVNEKPLYIMDNKIVFRDTGIPGNVVELAGSSLPKQIWLDGEIIPVGR
jgi:hypothetical protein